MATTGVVSTTTVLSVSSSTVLPPISTVLVPQSSFSINEALVSALSGAGSELFSSTAPSCSTVVPSSAVSPDDADSESQRGENDPPVVLESGQ